MRLPPPQGRQPQRGISRRKRSRRTFTPPGCPTRTSLSAPAASCVFPTFCFGRARTVSTILPLPSGPISDGRSFAVHCGITAPASAASDVRKKRLRLEIRLLEPESWQIQKWLRFVFFYGSGKRQTADIIRFPDKTVSNRFANCVKCRCLQIQMNL